MKKDLNTGKNYEAINLALEFLCVESLKLVHYFNVYRKKANRYH